MATTLSLPAESGVDTQALSVSLIDEMLGFLEAASEFATCFVKTQRFPLYSAFYELYHGRGFCDDGPLELWERALAGLEFGTEGASKIGFKMAGGVSIILGLRRTFAAAGPILAKIKSIKLDDLVDLLIGIAQNFKGGVENLFDFVKKIFHSAKKYGFKNGDQVKNVAELSGKAKIDNLDTFLSTAARHSDGSALIFKADKAVEHFAKHGSEMKNALGKSSYNLKEYMLDAHHVVKNGQYVPEMNGYVRLIGGQGSAKAAFVGMTKDGKNLTTMHVKTVSELKKKAPSLGWE